MRLAVAEVASGVPQGSVLGPILFLIYVNSITSLVNCKWTAFADDFKLCMSFLHDSCLSVLQGMMQKQRDLDSVCSLARSWNLKLNIHKCVVMRFGGSAGIRLTGNYDVDGVPLTFVASHRGLGVLVDVKLKFHDHVRVVVKKASGMVGELLRATVCRSPSFMVSLFVSHIRPIMNFCSCV